MQKSKQLLSVLIRKYQKINPQNLDMSPKSEDAYIETNMFSERATTKRYFQESPKEWKNTPEFEFTRVRDVPIRNVKYLEV